MSIQRIGFEQGPESPERSRGRLDRPASRSTPAASADGRNTDAVSRPGVTRGMVEFNRLSALGDRACDVAESIRRMNQPVDTASLSLAALKQKLGVIVKDYPPYPPGSEERVEWLRSFAGLRVMIDRLSLVPDAQTADAAALKEIKELLSMDERNAEAAFRQIRQDLAVQPTGITGGSTVQLDQLPG